MKVTKHYEQDHVILYVEEGDMQTCITLDSGQQMKRLGQCIIDLDRTEGRQVIIEPKTNYITANATERPKEEMQSQQERSEEDENPNISYILRLFGGKYVLRDGDLHAEEINLPFLLHHYYSCKFLNKLNEQGLLFDSLTQAELARNKMLRSLRTIVY